MNSQWKFSEMPGHWKHQQEPTSNSGGGLGAKLGALSPETNLRLGENFLRGTKVEDNSITVTISGNPAYSVSASHLHSYEDCINFFDAVLNLTGFCGLKVVDKAVCKCDEG